MRFVFSPPAGQVSGLLTLPWAQPLEDWHDERLVEVRQRGLSRHVVRFVADDGELFALKSISEHLARREYRLLRSLADLGIPAVELRKLAQRGGLRHVARGIYRFDEVPVTGHDQFMEAVLTVGPGAHLTHDAVLSLHDLGLVNPSKIRVGTDRRVRGQLPAFVDVVRVPAGTVDVTTYEGIPSATIERALLDCRGIVMGERLVEATKEAARRGLLVKKAERRVLDAVGAVA